MTKKSLVKSAAILSAAGLIVKLLGACFRIPLANWIGNEGMANYSPAYQLYAFLLVIATAGIPVAISRMVAERNAVGRYREAERVFKLSRDLMFVIGAAGFVILFFFAEGIAELISNPGAALSMKTTAPALLIVPVMSAYRGYFQGMQDMTPTAVSQIAEQLFRVFIGLLLAWMCINAGLMSGLEYNVYERGAAGACFGASAGAVGGIGAIMIIYLGRRKAIKRNIALDDVSTGESAGSILKKVIAIAIPVSIGSSIMPVVNLTDGAIVVSRLMSGGYTQEMAKGLYGDLSGFAQPIISFPQVFMQAIVISIVPMVAAANRIGDRDELHRNSVMGIRLAAVIAIPCAAGLIALAEPVLLLLYPTQAASAASAAPCLQILAVGFVFSGFATAMTGILQGIGKQNYPVTNLAIGVVLKIIATWVLTSIPGLNIRGAAVGTALAFAVAAVLDYICVRKFTGVKVPMGNTVVKPLVSSLVMGIAVYLVYRGLMALSGHNSISVLVSILAGVCIYAVMIIRTHAIDREELMNMPKASVLVKIIDRLKLW
ncbi:MAG: polysaccharide biosynthesis protein [Clostridiales bacterium]|nr:polysaccharide biosynthesis protein [Clostridiales bacterium]MDD7034618.1 polysaccharide biosynthesis protein [Bacillota bacterium]MDY2919753.1 polysaccharide biosynthesis protein [Lentihominibacter sp.]